MLNNALKKQRVKHQLKKQNTILFTFLFFVVLLAVFFLIYADMAEPSSSSVEELIKKFKVDDYSIPYYVADRYLTWHFIWYFFSALNYALTLLGVIASLMTVFYASTDLEYKSSIKLQKRNNPHKKKAKIDTIIFLSLLSVSFTIASIFITPGTLANRYQDAWRKLDMCIIKTVYNSELQDDEKNQILIDKIAEIEQYIEISEH